MIRLNIKNETAALRSVVLGTALSCGPTPAAEEAYDPKSLEHILAGTYPREVDMVKEMDVFATVLRKHGVQVFRPKVLENRNQIFARDIAFVIEDKLIKANIIPDREAEFEAIKYVLDRIDEDQIICPPDEVHIEGGDIMPWNEYIFIGTYSGSDYSNYITARTNRAAVDFIANNFPNKMVKSFELRKSNSNPRENTLHLDCCFQPIGRDMAILHKASFLREAEYQWLFNYFGKDKVFEITETEMYHMTSNIFSISPEVVVSDKNFIRLNNWLRERSFTVEEISYTEIAKQGGLLRCSTLPLFRG